VWPSRDRPADENLLTTSTENVSPAPAGAVPGPGAAAGSGRGARALQLARRHPWFLVGVGIVVVSTAILLWARTSPGYDPYGWLVWGYQTLRLTLNLGGAPSWKPVTYLFTVPYSVFGHLSYWLWMVTAVSISFAGPVLAGKVAYRIVRPGSDSAWPAIVAAVFAAAGVLGIVQYEHYVLSAQSDPMLVTFSLLAIDCLLSRRYRWVFLFLWLSSLGRPETWPFLGLYSLWAWRELPQLRRMIAGGLILIPVLWFGIPVICGNPPFVAGALAQGSPRELHSGKVIGTIDRFRDLTYAPIKVAAGLAVLIALWRRNRVALGLAAGCVLWVLVEIAFALHGWPAVPRYMFEAGAAMIVLAGVAVGWILQETARISRALQAGGLAVVVALFGVLIPDALAAARWEHRDLRHERARTTQIHQLDAAIKALGGYRFIRSCGDPSSDVEWVSILAWYTKLDVGFVGHRPKFEIYVQKQPAVLFTALYNGWVVHTYHLLPRNQARCASLNRVYYLVTRQHPGGYLLRKS
jgi:hypothetical protein